MVSTRQEFSCEELLMCRAPEPQGILDIYKENEHSACLNVAHQLEQALLDNLSSELKRTDYGAYEMYKLVSLHL